LFEQSLLQTIRLVTQFGAEPDEGLMMTDDLLPEITFYHFLP